MSETVNLPALGESVTEGTVTRWLKQVGDEVAVDEALVEVSTDKVDTEVPSPVAGVVEKILVDEDEDVEVGAPLVVIGDGSGSSDQDSDSGADTAEESASQDSAQDSSDDSGDSSEEAQEAPKADTKQASGNSVEVTLPALGESVTEGTVTRWLKQVGESIEVDEPLLEVSTDKVDTEVPSPVAGTILEIKVQEDEDAEVGQVLAIVGDESAAGSGDSGSDNGSSEKSGETKAEKVEDAATTADSGEDTEQAAEAKTEQAPTADTKQASGNSVEVTLPALGESVTEGTVTRWLKQVGESIEVDEPLLEVSTDKVDTEVPSPVAGTILEIKVQEDEDAEVGQVLAIVGDESAAGSGDSGSDNGSSEKSGETKAEKVEDAATTADSGEDTEQAAEAKTEQAPQADTKQASPQSGGDSSSAGSPSKDVPGYVTPLVRKLAREKNVDLGSLTGTGVGGRIRKQDVLAAAEKAEKSSAPAVQDTGADLSPAVSRQSTEPAAARLRTPSVEPRRRLPGSA